MSWLLSLALFGRVALAAVWPQPVGYVNDWAEVISPAIEAELETKLENFTASTGNELAVVTLKSLEGDVIENTAVKLFEQWGIGAKDKDNGVLFLVAPNEREMRIEVGYGLEPVLNDARAGRIIRDDVTPEFKNNNYDAGVTKGTDSIIAIVGGNDPAPEPAGVMSESNVSALAVALGMITIYGVAYFWRSKKFWPGGLVGFLLGLLMGLGGAAVLIALYGFFLDWMLSRNYKYRKSKKLPTSWKSTWGGFSSGHSSGGFGGFSGGSSGGGGASGRW
jgi:uncharacterized protein